MLLGMFHNIRSSYKKSILFLYTCNKQSKNHINNSICDSIKNNKMLRSNLTKEVQSLYSGNYKTLFK